jgi:hypothetical protein
VEPKSSTDLFDNIAAAHCLATLSSELTQTKRKKSGLTQTKRKKSKLTHTKRKKIDVPTNPIVISPQKKHAAHKLLLMKIHGQPLSPRTI